jgi:uncharacterized protein YqeY
MPDISLIDRLAEDMKDALRTRDTVRLGTIRLLRSQLQNATIQQGRGLSEEEVLTVLSSAVKLRKEAIEKFKQGQRQDLVEKEQAELDIIQSYLPEPLSEGDLSALIDQTLQEVGAKGPGDLGLVMKKIMPQVRGRAEGGLVNRLARERLQKLSS